MSIMTRRSARQKILPPVVTGQEAALIGVIGVLWLTLWQTTPAFLTLGSIRPLLIEMTPIALIGVGMTLVISSAGIDVSVSGGLMVCAVLTAKLLVSTALPTGIVIAAALVVGALLGSVNAILIIYGGVHPIIITFGTMNIFQFIGLQIFGSHTVDGIPDTLAFLGGGGTGLTLGIPHSFLIMLTIAATIWWYMRHAVGGRHFYAIGSDNESARLAGIPVRRRMMFAYILTGALVGLAAIFTVAKGTSSLDQSVGSGLELQVIAATVIGGTSIVGGRGTVLGTLLGALLVQTVTSGVTQLHWPSQLANFFVGLFILVAVGTDLLRQRMRRKS